MAVTSDGRLYGWGWNKVQNLNFELLNFYLMILHHFSQKFSGLLGETWPHHREIRTVRNGLLAVSETGLHESVKR